MSVAVIHLPIIFSLSPSIVGVAALSTLSTVHDVNTLVPHIKVAAITIKSFLVISVIIKLL